MNKVIRIMIVVFSLPLSTTICAEKVVFIMGPSCSGKSTIAKKVIEQLDEQWVLVGYDEIEDRLQSRDNSESVLIELIAVVNENLIKNKSVIVDTNVFEESILLQLPTTDIVCIYIYAPLDTLLERDALRTINLKRSEQNAIWAKDYVIKSFNSFYPKESCFSDKNYIDTTIISREQSVENIVELIDKVTE